MKENTIHPVSIKTFRTYFLKYRRSSQIPDPEKIFAPIIAILPKLAIGPFYWNIGCVPALKMVAIGGDVDTLTPYTKNEWLGAPPEFAFSHIYPPDIAYCMAYIMKLDKYIRQVPIAKRKFINANVFCRMKNAAGFYRWYAITYPGFYYDKNDSLLYVLSLCSDISHIKSGEGKPFLSILDSSGKKQLLYTCREKRKPLQLETDAPLITSREIQIIKLLSLGKTSKEIATSLCIAKNTVDNRRQTLLKKFKVHSSAELVSAALQNGCI